MDKAKKLIQNSFLVAIIFSFMSCSQMSRNNVSEGKLEIEDGVVNGTIVSDILKFNRRSWHFDFTLSFDLLWTKMEQNSTYKAWLSERERKYIDECQHFYIVFMYEKNNDFIGVSDFKDQMRQYPVKFVGLQGFKKHIKLHGEYIDHSLQLYKLEGMCVEKGRFINKLTIRFPNFPQAQVFN